jgi:hypothetical protein
MTTPSPAVVIPMQRIIKIGSLAFLLIPVLAAVALVIGGTSAAWGVVLGGAIPWVFFGVTAFTALKTAGTAPEKLGAIILASWLLKIVALIAVLAWMRGQDFYSRPVFFVVLLLASAGLLVFEALISTRTKVPYVDPL